MKEIDPITGQSIDHQENKDNSPPRYSAPDIRYKLVLKYHANQECSRCGGTGYIGQFKHISVGRCFECLPDRIWESRFGEHIATGVCDYTKEEKCEIRKISNDNYTEAGFVVTKVGLPPYGDFKVFETKEEAFEEAKKVYNI